MVSTPARHISGTYLRNSSVRLPQSTNDERVEVHRTALDQGPLWWCRSGLEPPDARAGESQGSAPLRMTLSSRGLPDAALLRLWVKP